MKRGCGIIATKIQSGNIMRKSAEYYCKLLSEMQNYLGNIENSACRSALMKMYSTLTSPNLLDHIKVVSCDKIMQAVESNYWSEDTIAFFSLSATTVGGKRLMTLDLIETRRFKIKELEAFNKHKEQKPRGLFNYKEKKAWLEKYKELEADVYTGLNNVRQEMNIDIKKDLHGSNDSFSVVWKIYNNSWKNGVMSTDLDDKSYFFNYDDEDENLQKLY